MNQTELFLRAIEDFAKEGISDHVRERFKLALLDFLGVTFAGIKANEEKISKLLELADEGPISVIGLDQTLGMENAVFLNGLNAHALDFDDGTNSGIIHLGSPIFSVLLPLAKKYHVPVEKFIKAAIIGYETSYTMAVSIQPRHKELGFHATGTCSTLGIVLAVAELLDFTPKQRWDAFSAAAVSATGTLKVLEDGSDLKPYNVGKTALMGYTAAKMGFAGYNGPDDVLSGDRGFLNMMVGTDEVTFLPPRLNGTSALEKSYIKPYAACRYCHPSIEAALIMRGKNRLTVDDIDSILVKTYSLAVNKHDHTEIAGTGSAKMSIPYSVAVSIAKGKAGFDEFEPEIISDEAILELTRRVRVEADEAISLSFPEKQTAIVDIVLKNKTTLSKQVDFPKGEPENPLSVEEARQKFTELTTYCGRSIAEADEIFDAVMDIENQFEHLLSIINYNHNLIV